MIDERRLGNKRQIISYDVVRAEDGGRLLIARVGHSETVFNIERAMDILSFNYRGCNISFLSKNGRNSSRSANLAERFEGGFLYTLRS